MSVKSILTIIKDAQADAVALDAAIAAAESCEAHLDLLCVGLDRTNPGLYYAGATALSLQQSIDQARADAEAVEAAVRNRMRAEVISWEVIPGIAQLETVTALVSGRARFADLVILPRPYGEHRSSEDVAMIEAALFGSRSPVLVVPPSGAWKAAPRRAVVGWDGSAEALAAVKGALPLLRAADSVSVTIIDPPSHDSRNSDPGADIARMLARQGVAAEVVILPRSMPRVSEVLLRHARDLDADLIVMGAYGHSRFRESILGGATREMLEKSDLPVLMGH